MVTSSWPVDPCDALRETSGTANELKTRLSEEIAPFYLTEEQAALIGAPTAVVLCLPVYNDAGRGALLFAANEAEPEGFHAGLHLYALYIFVRISTLTRPRLPAAALAPREIDCLRWSAAGKTSGEIAAILGVSENTVNSYLAAAAQKLNAVNRVQTVAQAIRLGLLP
ncbi:LuxR family transcriptional regulator [bacterium]|nr:MAG: LuxR family transcriptional regulator [bacterium]